MPEWDHIVMSETNDPVLGYVSYSVTLTINVICPNCGNPDCQEVEEFKQRMGVQLWPPIESDV